MFTRSVRTIIAALIALVVIPTVSHATIHTITMSGTSFTPKGTIVHWGDTVRWNNSSGVHTTTSDVTSDKAWNSGTVNAGGHFDLVFVQADGTGAFAYQCNFHSTLGMKDTINVVASSCCTGQRGNVNCTGIVDLVDLSTLVTYLTAGGITLCCTEAANVNGTGIVDLVDLSSLVSFLTGGGFVPGNCP
jgi:plastocyanin